MAAAIRQFLTPEGIVALPDAAGCQLNAVLAHFHTGDHEHDETDEHMEGDHDHDHDKAEGDAHEHEHEHGDEAEAKHSEFHVTYGFHLR
ncbi:ZrgA family zinc uptake protein [Roseovarius sp.]|uniref:ZrgA family zinc uptake protein n=1 Tax=Roseovarius sp. TaxID=1486281 RepID=UPI003B5AF99D